MNVCFRANDDRVSRLTHLGSVAKAFRKLLMFIPMLRRAEAYQVGAYIDAMTTSIEQIDPDVFVGYLAPNLEGTTKAHTFIQNVEKTVVNGRTVLMFNATHGMEIAKLSLE